MKQGKRFSVCIQNPPYGSVGGDTLHLKFVDKCLDIANYQVTVMPFTFVTKVHHKPAKKYKEKFSPYLSEVEEVDSKYFKDTAMPNVGIYVFGNETKYIDIKYVNSTSETLTSLLDKSEFTKYENEIVKYLSENGQINCVAGGGHDHVTRQSLNKLGIFDNDEIVKLIEQNIKDNCSKIPENNIYLLVNSVNGGMNGTFMSSKAGIIFTNKQDLIDTLVERKTTTFSNFLLFKTIKAAENCKIALKNPLLRFTCYRLQNDQMMTLKRVYKYVPDINWEDTRVKTDEGILEVCGCPKDKCKEYADYCKKIIEEVDNKK